MFKNKILLISGGTGSFGGVVLKRFLTTDIKEIRIFSRDELKQDDMRKFYNNDKLKFHIGDVRDKNSIDDAMRGVDSSKITVIPNCISEEFTSTSKKFNVSNPRILCIGTGPNKNLENLIAAVALLNCNLRIIGDINPTQQDILNYHKISFSSATRLTEEQIVEEYRQTDIVSFVSLYEGFGLPILEAQASGRALITSNLHPMNDVAGKDACLVDPYDIVSIYEGLQKIITNVEYRKILIRAGLKNSENFSSAAVSELYAEIYRKMSE